MNAKTAARSLKYFSTGFRCLPLEFTERLDVKNADACERHAEIFLIGRRVFEQLCDNSHAKNTVMTMQKRLLAIRKQVELG